jgi:hypothetical protein
VPDDTSDDRRAATCMSIVLCAASQDDKVGPHALGGTSVPGRRRESTTTLALSIHECAGWRARESGP